MGVGRMKLGVRGENGEGREGAWVLEWSGVRCDWTESKKQGEG